LKSRYKVITKGVRGSIMKSEVLQIKSEVLQIRLTEDEKNIIKKVARKNKMSMSEFLLYSAMKLITENELYTKHLVYRSFSELEEMFVRQTSNELINKYTSLESD